MFIGERVAAFAGVALVFCCCGSDRRPIVFVVLGFSEGYCVGKVVHSCERKGNWRMHAAMASGAPLQHQVTCYIQRVE